MTLFAQAHGFPADESLYGNVLITRRYVARRAATQPHCEELEELIFRLELVQYEGDIL